MSLAGDASRRLRALAKPAVVRARYRHYVEGDGRALGRLPARVRDRLGLDDAEAVGSRRVEIGGGPYARPGYIHVDADPGAQHLEAVADAWSLPFPDDWATEILAVHVLEHVPPPRLVETLAEWHRVLAPGGVTEIHVPNFPELFEAYARHRLPEKWALMGAITGMYADPKRTRSPDALTHPADHQVLFDEEVLGWALTEAGFGEVENRTAEIEDRHTVGWRDFLPHCSLVVTAVKGGGAGT